MWTGPPDLPADGPVNLTLSLLTRTLFGVVMPPPPPTHSRRAWVHEFLTVVSERAISYSACSEYRLGRLCKWNAKHVMKQYNVNRQSVTLKVSSTKVHPSLTNNSRKEIGMRMCVICWLINGSIARHCQQTTTKLSRIERWLHWSTRNWIPVWWRLSTFPELGPHSSFLINSPAAAVIKRKIY